MLRSQKLQEELNKLDVLLDEKVRAEREAKGASAIAKARKDTDATIDTWLEKWFFAGKEARADLEPALRAKQSWEAIKSRTEELLKETKDPVLIRVYTKIVELIVQKAQGPEFYAKCWEEQILKTKSTATLMRIKAYLLDAEQPPQEIRRLRNLVTTQLSCRGWKMGTKPTTYKLYKNRIEVKKGDQAQLKAFITEDPDLSEANRFDLLERL